MVKPIDKVTTLEDAKDEIYFLGKAMEFQHKIIDATSQIIDDDEARPGEVELALNDKEMAESEVHKIMGLIQEIKDKFGL